MREREDDARREPHSASATTGQGPPVSRACVVRHGRDVRDRPAVGRRGPGPDSGAVALVYQGFIEGRIGNRSNNAAADGGSGGTGGIATIAVIGAGRFG